MGVFDKIKNMFLEDEEEEVKTGMIQVEIPAPTKKEETIVKEEVKEDVTDNNLIKKEEKPAAPIFFDDDYFKELEQPKKEKKKIVKKEKLKPIEKKVFKPTPIISPVYGVLDKNYKKEEINSKKNISAHKNENLSIDDIRRKAFGTLEDDLEATLFGDRSFLFNEEIEETEELENDLFDELITEETIELELETSEEKEDDIIEELDKEIIGETELFDLIDSMYEEDEK